jgi:hypothetical protein
MELLRFDRLTDLEYEVDSKIEEGTRTIKDYFNEMKYQMT